MSNASLGFKKILVPLDGSRFAEGALPYAQMLAEHSGGQIELLRIAVHPSSYVYVNDPAVLASLYDSDRAHCEEYLQKVAAGLRGTTSLTITTAVLEGPVADAILDRAEETNADLIVMSTHGRSGMERWLLGSVAEKVVRGARIPVMLVRPKQPGAPATAADAAQP
ncbi:MAG: universal stress protein [Thermoflexales bacterium]|nr:universal stress protein [Thermoflexales bacterium]MDW8352705.1 universal stress protein [Anaerolineae bacterium]